MSGAVGTVMCIEIRNAPVGDENYVLFSITLSGMIEIRNAPVGDENYYQPFHS